MKRLASAQREYDQSLSPDDRRMEESCTCALCVFVRTQRAMLAEYEATLARHREPKDEAEALAMIRAAAEAGPITYAGRDVELEYLRDAIAREQDPDLRARMQARLAHVEGRTAAEMDEEMAARFR